MGEITIVFKKNPYVFIDAKKVILADFGKYM